MTRTDDDYARRHGLMRVPRSRGAISGVLLIALGIWGAAIPFFGPYFDYAYTPASALTWTLGRLWLEILPGLAAIVGGFLLLTTANRAVAIFGGYLAAAAGAWFIVGPILGRLWAGPEGATGVPTGSTARQVVEQLGFFYGLGAVILYLAAQALGRFTVRSVRDYQAAQRHRDDATRTDDRGAPGRSAAVRPGETVGPTDTVRRTERTVVAPASEAITVTGEPAGRSVSQPQDGGATRL